jgi:hypothetical protein
VLCDRFQDRSEFRLLLIDQDEEWPASLLCVVQPNDSRPVFLIGPSSNLGLNQPMTSQVNVAVHGDGELLEQCRNWFNFVWLTTGIPLRQTTARIPMLMPAQGDPHAAVLWKEYYKTCQRELEHPNDDHNTCVVVDAKTGETRIEGSEGGTETAGLPTESLGVPRFDEVCRKITEIVGQGCLATIDKGSRVAPFDCPIRPEWFGLDGSKQYGMITQTTGLRVSVIDDKALKKLNGYRHKTRALLTALSFPWAEGLRWIPNAAKPLLENEIERTNDEGLKLLGTTVGDEVGKFVDGRKDLIEEAAKAIYEQWHPGRSLPKGVVEKIADESKRRLEGASGGQLLAKICYTAMQIGQVTESRWSTPWSQYLDFLIEVVKFPRKCFTDKFFLTGLEVEPDDALKAMDVAKDHLVKDHFADKRVDRVACTELELLKDITGSDAEDRVKCSALLLLLQGAKPEEIKALASSSQTEKESSITDSQT